MTNELGLSQGTEEGPAALGAAGRARPRARLRAAPEAAPGLRVGIGAAAEAAAPAEPARHHRHLPVAAQPSAPRPLQRCSCFHSRPGASELP